MLGVLSATFAELKEIKRRFPLFSVRYLSRILLKDLHSSFVCLGRCFFVLKKEERKRRPPKPLPWFFRLPYFILYIFTYLLVRKIREGLCI